MANKFIIEVKAKGFTNLEGQLNKADGAMKKFDNTGGRIRGTTSGLRREIGALRNNLLLYTFAVGAAARVMSGFLKQASNLQESLSKFKVVFGDASDDALDFAGTLAKSFNRSEASIIELMASLQDTFVPLGFSRQEARKLSQTLAQLSFDIGSFNNAASPEVAHALTSAIVGNHEAVRRFGIVLTEVQLKQEAYRAGIKTTAGDLTAQEKVLARVSLILRSTKDAQGDLIRTQDEFANQVRKVQDDLRDLQIEIGKVLMPVAALGLEFLKIERIKGYASALGVAATAYGVYRAQALLAAGATMTFRTALIKTGFGIAIVAAGELASRFLFTEDATEGATGALSDYNLALKENVKVTQKSMIDIVRMLEHKRHMNEVEMDITDAINAATNKLQTWKDEVADMDEVTATLEDTGDFLDQFINQQLDDMGEKLLDSKDTAVQLGVELAQGDLARSEAQILKTAQGFKQFSDHLGRAVVDGQNFGEAVVNSLRAIAAELAAQAASFMILNMITGGSFSASKAGFDLLGGIFGHSGGAVTKRGVQRFQSGGVVGGKDNVPILAQSGEFIMRREAVQSIGLDQLQQMNETGQSNNLTVNISAPMVDETVVDHIIPAIEKAARFNLA